MREMVFSRITFSSTNSRSAVDEVSFERYFSVRTPLPDRYIRTLRSRARDPSRNLPFVVTTRGPRAQVLIEDTVRMELENLL